METHFENFSPPGTMWGEQEEVINTNSHCPRYRLFCNPSLPWNKCHIRQGQGAHCKQNLMSIVLKKDLVTNTMEYPTSHSVVVGLDRNWAWIWAEDIINPWRSPVSIGVHASREGVWLTIEKSSCSPLSAAHRTPNGTERLNGGEKRRERQKLQIIL